MIMGIVMNSVTEWSISVMGSTCCGQPQHRQSRHGKIARTKGLKTLRTSVVSPASRSNASDTLAWLSKVWSCQLLLLTI